MGKGVLIVGEPERDLITITSFSFSSRIEYVTQKSQTLRSFFKTVTASATAVSHPLWPKREQNSSKTFDMIISQGTQVEIDDVSIIFPKSSTQIDFVGGVGHCYVDN